MQDTTTERSSETQFEINEALLAILLTAVGEIFDHNPTPIMILIAAATRAVQEQQDFTPEILLDALGDLQEALDPIEVKRDLRVTGYSSLPQIGVQN